MEHPADSPKPTARDLADLSALADGSLDPSREHAVRAMIASSPQLRARYERERQAVEALNAVRADRAPDRLRARIEAQRRAATPQRRAATPQRRAGGRRPIGRLAYGGAAAAALAVVALALILLLPSGTPGAPSISQAAALALRGSTGPAPAADSSHPGRLSVDVGDVYFPDLSRSLGFRAIGERTDTFDGRQAVTVYYRHHGAVIAYTIVAEPALRLPNTSTKWVNGADMHMFTVGGRWVVAWLRGGDTCIVSGKVASATQLAAWSS